jgi:hypothetical protein
MNLKEKLIPGTIGNTTTNLPKEDEEGNNPSI